MWGEVAFCDCKRLLTSQLPIQMLLCRRQGSKDVSVKIRIETDSQPEVAVLSNELAQFMRCKLSTRIPVLQALSAYFKMHNLQVYTP